MPAGRRGARSRPGRAGPDGSRAIRNRYSEAGTGLDTGLPVRMLIPLVGTRAPPAGAGASRGLVRGSRLGTRRRAAPRYDSTPTQWVQPRSTDERGCTRDRTKAQTESLAGTARGCPAGPDRTATGTTQGGTVTGRQRDHAYTRGPTAPGASPEELRAGAHGTASPSATCAPRRDAPLQASAWSKFA